MDKIINGEHIDYCYTSFQTSDAVLRQIEVSTFNDVDSKHSKWSTEKKDQQQIEDNLKDTSSQTSGSSENSRMNENGELEPKTSTNANTSGSMRSRPECRDDAPKRKRKGKSVVSKSNFNSKFSAQLHAIQLLSQEMLQVMKSKLDIEKHKLEMFTTKAEARVRRRHMKLLQILLKKQNLCPAEERVKLNIIGKLLPD